jgi:serine/threonine-protein kinase
MKEILALQNRAARSLAREMGASMNTTGQAEMTPRTVNPAAYDAYLKSLVHFMDSLNQPREAIASAQRVIELDPTFAPGYALLSELYGYLALTTPMNQGEAYVQSRRFAHLAMELDPWHPYSRFAMARVYYQFEWDWAAAEAEFQQGLELDPNNANGLAMYGAYQVVILKDCSSGIETLESARDRDPFNAGLYFDLGVYNLHCRSYDTALAYFEQTLELRPGFYFARLFASWVHGMLGAHEQATSECRVLLSEHRATFDPYLLMLCGVVFAQSGNPDEAESMLAELEHPPGDFQVDPVVTAILYIALGEMDRGLDALEDGLEKRSPNLIFIRVAPAWDPVRENPRFTAILSRMKFPDD